MAHVLLAQLAKMLDDNPSDGEGSVSSSRIKQDLYIVCVVLSFYPKVVA